MELEDTAARLGAKDVFVLRRISTNQFFNVAGFGRGEGWAGNISIDTAAEPWLSSVLSEGFQVRRSGIPFRAFGPYWATEVAGVGAEDTVVVFSGSGVSGTPPETFAEALQEIEVSACEVSIEKQEADELELRQAVDTVNSITATTSDEAAGEIIRATAQALSCEFGALLVYGPPMRLFIADEGWRPTATDEEVMAAIYPLARLAADGPFVEQDLSTSPYAFPPLSFSDGLVTRCTVSVGPQGSVGLVVVAHAGTAPRGFTSLCSQVAAAIGENAAAVLTSSSDEVTGRGLGPN